MNKRTEAVGNIIRFHDPDYVLAQEASPLPDHVKATVRSNKKV